MRVKAWADLDTSVMEERLNILLSTVVQPSQSIDLPRDKDAMSVDEATSLCDLPAGWRQIGHASAWKACPIGVYVEG